MPLFPLFADLSGREVLVVGGGEVATRKVGALLQAGAQVQIHAYALDVALSQWLAQVPLRHREGDFEPAWLDEVWLVVAATDDRAFNARRAAEAGRRRRLANLVDDAELSTFQAPAIMDRARVLSAFCIGKWRSARGRQTRIGTSGRAPSRQREQKWRDLRHVFCPLQGAEGPQHRAVGAKS